MAFRYKFMKKSCPLQEIGADREQLFLFLYLFLFLIFLFSEHENGLAPADRGNRSLVKTTNGNRMECETVLVG